MSGAPRIATVVTSKAPEASQKRPLPATPASGGMLEAAYFRTRHPIHRVRYGELCLVERHVHVEALTVRDPVARTPLAKGLRFLLRAEPIEEPPRRDERRPDYEMPMEADFPRLWLDPVPEGPPHQTSVNVFVDLEDVTRLAEGLGHVIDAAGRWRQQESYSRAEWMETVFAWENSLVLGIIQREATQAGFIESRADRRLYFQTSQHHLSRLRTWVDRVKTDLEAAP